MSGSYLDIQFQLNPVGTVVDPVTVNSDELLVYKSGSDLVDYERLRLHWDIDTITVSSEKLGTGTLREIHIDSGSFLRLNGVTGQVFEVNGVAEIVHDSTGFFPNLDLTGSFGKASFRWADAYIATVQATNVLSSYIGFELAEITNTPVGTTQTITLVDGNHQTLDLTSATGTVTVTLTVPTNVSCGTILYLQHGSVVRDLTWAVSSGVIKWLGGEPDWSADSVDDERAISWRFDGTNTYLASTNKVS